MKLILKLLAGMALGLGAGFLGWQALLQTLFTFKMLFGQFIGFVIPLIILFYLLSGIGSLKNESGKLLASTVGIAYASTLGAGVVAYLVARQILPAILTPFTPETAQAAPILPYFHLKIPPLMDVMSALVLAFTFGIGMTVTASNTLKRGVEEGRHIMDLVLGKIIVPLLPLYIAAIFSELAYNGTVFTILHGFGIVLLLAIALHLCWLLVLYRVATWLSRNKYLPSLAKMAPAYLTALGCMSSAATLPVTMNCARKLKVSEPVVDFVIPLCATIHLSGSTITIVSCALAVFSLSHGGSIPGALEFLPFIMMLGITMIAAPGAPGGGVMSALGLLAGMLGFSEAQIALMIALYVAQDGFGTACNVTGDGAISLIVDEIETRSAKSA